MRKNAQSLAAVGGRGGHWETIRYRRYIRLMPPDLCLVLQDACPLALAAKVLIEGVDPKTHVNTKPERVEALSLTAADVGGHVSDAATLKKKICLGKFTFSAETKIIDIKYQAGDDDWHVVVKLSHAGPNKFADQLEWSLYTKTHGDETDDFDLGKLPDWKGGGLKEEGKDHFPCMDLKPTQLLEHLLQ